MSRIIQIMMKVCSPKDFSKSGYMIQELLKEKVKLKVKSNFAKKFIKENLPWFYLVKIGYILMIYLALFMLNFHMHHHSLKFKESKVTE